jgi:hypothetical protein
VPLVTQVVPVFEDLTKKSQEEEEDSSSNEEGGGEGEEEEEWSLPVNELAPAELKQLLAGGEFDVLGLQEATLEDLLTRHLPEVG